MLKAIRKLLRNEKGFTMIELMIVIIIIGVLAAIAVPVYSEAAQKSKISRAKADLRTLESAISIYYAENNEYPENLDELVDDYIKAVPKDPWQKQDYDYRSSDGRVRLKASSKNGLTEHLYSYSEIDD